MMPITIALFNHKGGVSKTTTTFNLGWMLASKDKKVILVDADPQCNLTGMVLGYAGQETLDTYYETHPGQNICDALRPAFDAAPRVLQPLDCIEISGRPSLWVMAGHVSFAEYEVSLGVAQELSGSLTVLQNLPGSIAFLIDKTAQKYEADYVLIDMSPSLGAINQNLFSISDYFIIPTAPDVFSVMALDSLARVLPRWATWAKMAQSQPILRDAAYPFPAHSPRLLGVIIQNYRIREGQPSNAFQRWIEKLNTVIVERLVPKLGEAEMLLPRQLYPDNYVLASISNFNSLIAASQEHGTPVYAFTPSQLGQRGAIADRSEEKIMEFNDTFGALAEFLLRLA